MTQRVRPVYRRHRRGMIACGLVALVAGLVFAVLPAGSAAGASDQGVVPTVVELGGQTGDCAAVGSTAAYDFRIVNPKGSKTYTDPATGVKFAVTVKSSNTTAEFVVTGAGVEDVVIKGGTNSSHYDYLAGGPQQPVTWDKNLHAPPKGSTYYTVSHVSFCYSRVGKIAGDVWQDSNENQAKDGFESFQPNWTINLYTTGGTPYRSTTTNASGHYEFTSVPLGVQYTVCETKPADDSGSWGQTTPITAVCASLGSNESNGHQFTPTADALGKNFGNVNTVTLDCNNQSEPVSTPNGDYTVQLGGEGFCAKEGSNEYVFEAYTDPNQVANFHPQATGTGQVSLVERLSWDISNSQGSVLRYDDDVTNGISLLDMLYCNLDPRVEGEDFDLATTTGVLPSGHTSCLITSTEAAGGTRVDFVYSSVDGYRTVG